MQNGKLLWVDDEIDLLRAHIIFLENKGYSVDTATNGTDALEMCREKQYDLIMLDENMLTLVSGLPLERFVPFYQKFNDEFLATKRGRYRLHYKDKFLRVTFFLVESGRLLGAMFEDITSPTVRRETVVKKAEDVIENSLKTVQQIASLLGENAAETEIMLNSLIDAFSVHGGSEGDGFSLDEDRDL